MYILYDEPSDSLNKMRNLLQNANANVLRDWYETEKYQSNESVIKDRLLEAICTIQNYQLLRELS